MTHCTQPEVNLSVSMYLDANGGIPMCEQALQKYKQASELTNPSNTLSSNGKVAAVVYDSAVKYIRSNIGASTDILIAVSSATEANASVYWSVHKNFPCGNVVITSDSHPSTFAALDAYNMPHVVVPPNITKILDAMDDLTVMVSYPHVASLTGIINPSDEWSRQIRERYTKLIASEDKAIELRPLSKTSDAPETTILIHCDATQSIGRMRVNRTTLKCDYMTCSSHKFGGPKGVGFVVFAASLQANIDTKWQSLIPGAQQGGMRGGTHNVSGVIASAAALKTKLETLTDDRASTIASTKDLYRLLKPIEPRIKILNVETEDDIDTTLGNTLLVEVGGCNKLLATRLADVGYDVGTGYACSTETESSTIRISLPMGFSEPLDEFVASFESLVEPIHSPSKKVDVKHSKTTEAGSPDEHTKTADSPSEYAKEIGLDIDELPGGLKAWTYAIETEKEHGPPPKGTSTTDLGDATMYPKIALAHILELPDYYQRLAKLEKEAEAFWKGKKKPSIV